MRSRPMRFAAIALLPVSLLAVSCADDEDSADETTETTVEDETTTTEAAAEQTIVDIAASDPQFSTLVSLVTAAGLAETLSGDGPFTVFAPTNDAFAKLDPATVSALTADPQGALTDVLKLHVIDGEVMSTDAAALAGQNAETLGGPVAITAEGSDLYVGGAKVISADIEASNGVIHVIDTVITAPAA
jgi:uncharacterized surface protein with fasciclin (FAS1) repeats